MICYKDMTFCMYYSCPVQNCPRKLTEEVEKDAEKWWGKKDPPIAVSDFTNSCLKLAEFKKLSKD